MATMGLYSSLPYLTSIRSKGRVGHTDTEDQRYGYQKI